jgi:hypothetical protein
MVTINLLSARRERGDSVVGREHGRRWDESKVVVADIVDVNLLGGCA